MCIARMSVGIEFHELGPAYLKTRSPNVRNTKMRQFREVAVGLAEPIVWSKKAESTLALHSLAAR